MSSVSFSDNLSYLTTGTAGSLADEADTPTNRQRRQQQIHRLLRQSAVTKK